MAADHQIFDRRLLWRRRDRIASGAARHDFLLSAVTQDVLERLTAINRSFAVALNLGAHHGVLGRGLRALPGIETIVEAEASQKLLAQCTGLRLQADEEALPLRGNSLDLVVSALSLQMINDLPGTLAQVHHALKPDGLLLAAMLGGSTLSELRHSFLAAEEELEGGASPRIAPFADVRELGALLQRAGFALPVVDAHTIKVTYPNVVALMHELRSMAGANVLRSRRRTPLRRATLARAIQYYDEHFGLADGRIPATFEILTLTGWKPHESQQKPLHPGAGRVRLADALGVRPDAGSPVGRK